MNKFYWLAVVLFIVGSILGASWESWSVEGDSLRWTETALVILGNDTINAEVAQTSEERSKGLMGRQEVPDGTGMLFVFEREAMRSFWMQDTLVSLDIAFLDANMVIIDLQEMESRSSSIYSSSGPAKFALEVRKGWYKEHDIKLGLQVQIIFP